MASSDTADKGVMRPGAAGVARRVTDSWVMAGQGTEHFGAAGGLGLDKDRHGRPGVAD